MTNKNYSEIFKSATYEALYVTNSLSTIVKIGNIKFLSYSEIGQGDFFLEFEGSPMFPGINDPQIKLRFGIHYNIDYNTFKRSFINSGRKVGATYEFLPDSMSSIVDFKINFKNEIEEEKDEEDKELCDIFIAIDETINLLEQMFEQQHYRSNIICSWDESTSKRDFLKEKKRLETLKVKIKDLK